jgi:hypothetical protein
MAQRHHKNAGQLRIQTIQQDAVPKGRAGKHKPIVVLLLNQLDRLPPANALKISLAALPDSKANIRAALNRASHQMGLTIATSSDTKHLYLWKVVGKS